jgi:hypothetical protein
LIESVVMADGPVYTVGAIEVLNADYIANDPWHAFLTDARYLLVGTQVLATY